MGMTERSRSSQWLRPIHIGFFTLALCHGCRCEEDDPVGPDSGWDRFACSVTPQALDFGRVTAGVGAELPFTVSVVGNAGAVEVRPSQDCPGVSVLPAVDTILSDNSRTFTATYLPAAPAELACTAEVQVRPLVPPSSEALSCPSVALSGSAADAPGAWIPCGDPEDLAHAWAGVNGRSAAEVYLAGDQGRVLQYAGDCTWDDIGVDEPRADLTGVWVQGDGSGDTGSTLWAVGNFGSEGTILRRTDGLWSVLDRSALFTYGAVWGSGACDVLFVGTGASTDFPNGQRYDCDGLDPFQLDLGMSEVTGVSGTAADDVWAVLRQPTFQVHRFDGSAWSLATDPVVDQPLHDVWATGSGHVWVVGEQGSIFHWTGSGWTDESRNVDGTFYGVWAAETGQVLAVGEAGLAFYFDGEAWIEQTPGTVEDLRDVWGASVSEVFVVGRNSIFRFVGPDRP